jgi:cytochrome c oxidase subunit 3
MGLFHELGKKPWLTDHADIDAINSPTAFFLPAVKVGLRVFLVVVTVIFTLLIIAYANRMTFGSWRSMPEPWVLWLNTALLIGSSLAFQWARSSARNDDLNGTRDGLHIGGVLTVAFLAGQLFVWRQLVDLGYYADANTANAFFYLLTALHGAHMLGGLVAWWRCVSKMWQGSKVIDLRMSVELCTTYWHYLLLIWLVVFGLLLLS